MDEKDFKKFMIPVAILGLAVLSFLIIKPLFVPIILGLLFAYIFYPTYVKLRDKIKSENTSAFIIVFLSSLIILVPIILFLPVFVKQLFETYLLLKNADFSAILTQIFPTLLNNKALSAEVLASASHFGANISAFLLNIFQETVMSIPQIVFGAIILMFTFFFALKEGHDVKDYFSTLFPFPKEFQQRFFERFEQVTNSVIYGHLVVGLIQGIIGGIGFYMFGVPNALLLTILIAIVGILPVLGPVIVWAPLTLYLFVTGKTDLAIQLLVFSVLTTPVDTILRPQIVSKRAEMNTAIALIGAIGGTYAFGLVGFLIGPLILAYLILLIELYKNKKPEESIVIRGIKPSSEKLEDKKEVVL
jgi:predicted PurR-regulated permease PerM